MHNLSFRSIIFAAVVVFAAIAVSTPIARADDNGDTISSQQEAYWKKNRSIVRQAIDAMNNLLNSWLNETDKESPDYKTKKKILETCAKLLGDMARAADRSDWDAEKANRNQLIDECLYVKDYELAYLHLNEPKSLKGKFERAEQAINAVMDKPDPPFTFPAGLAPGAACPPYSKEADNALIAKIIQAFQKVNDILRGWSMRVGKGAPDIEGWLNDIAQKLEDAKNKGTDSAALGEEREILLDIVNLVYGKIIPRIRTIQRTRFRDFPAGDLIRALMEALELIHEKDVMLQPFVTAAPPPVAPPPPSGKKKGTIPTGGAPIAPPRCPEGGGVPVACLGDNRVPGGFEITDELGTRVIENCSDVRFAGLEYRCCRGIMPDGQPTYACTGYTPGEWRSWPLNETPCYGNAPAGTAPSGSTSAPPTPPRQTGATRSGKSLAGLFSGSAFSVTNLINFATRLTVAGLVGR